jgi:hypothetical protein
MTKERILMLAGIGILAVVAVVGWTRTEGTSPQTQTTLADPTPAADVPSYADRQSVRTISPAYAPGYHSEPAYADRREGYSTREATRERPLSRSLEIVGGSAGAGAAIGAVAGGGRGAGIGAVSGGAAGLMYDRLTHKRQVVADQQ